MVRLLDTDVLVIGSGISGCTTAIEANRNGANVVVIDKSLFGKSGSSRVGRRFTVWRIPEDIPPLAEKVKDDIVFHGSRMRYWYDQELVKKLDDLTWSVDRESNWGNLLFLEGLGVQFRRHPDGTIWSEPEVGSHAPIADVAGKLQLDTLGPEIRRRNITVLEEHMATRLLTHNGEVIGATALDIINGELVAIRAKATVLATGAHTPYPTSTPPDTLTGDGYALALKAGAEIVDLYVLTTWYNYFYPYGDDPKYPKTWRGMSTGAWTLRERRPGTHPQTAEMGAEFFTSDGKRILDTPPYKEMFENYPAVKAGVSSWRQATALVGKISAMEMKAGRGPVLADYTHIPNVKERMKKYWWRYPYLEKIGIDPSKERIKLGSNPHTVSGGIRMTAKAEAFGVSGLYAVGGCSALGTGMTLCVASGRWAGESTAERSKIIETPTLDWSQIQEEEERINRIRTKKVADVVFPATVKKMMRDVMGQKCGYWKDEKSMTEGLNELRRIRDEVIPKMCPKSDTKNYNMGVVYYLEALNMIDILEIVAEEMLMQRETRGSFVRTDFPKPYPKPRHVFVKLVDGEPKYTTLESGVAIPTY